ncbi:esterase/lipase family protein [Qaidamihabitans albus]|uniref:esterase/lipase family protein n=1 Tax=Qaidamihabitans albus TaxID=2795733 RepID=UPI0018F1C741|nr:alpha/beta fold hydrolase [Qaidamihabitans albus]
MVNQEGSDPARTKRARRKGLAAAVAAAAALTTGAVTPANAEAADTGTYPVINSGVAALANATVRPGTAPAGANDFSCRPSAEHPRPVVLVHGTVENMTYNWFSMSPRLANEGYCVFALNYGQDSGLGVGLPGAYPTGGSAAVPKSAAELARFVDRVLEATGSDEVDIVGHSQGGMMPRYYLKNLGGADEVNHLVALSPSNHGTDVHGLARLPGVPELLSAGLGDSVRDQIRGSDFLTDLNAGGDTVPGVEYTVIQTKYDEVVTPYTSAFLEGPDVTNVLLQDGCKLNATDHLGISFDRRAEQYVVNALDPANATQPPCVLSLPVNAASSAVR